MRLNDRLGMVALALLAAATGHAQAAGYLQTNLVTDGSDPAITAAHTDRNLVNPWAISFILYATNFRTGNIDVFDSNFNQVTVPGSFSDPKVQHRYAPFGIQTINSNLWVTYAMQNKAKHDPVIKPAHGFVSVFDTDGDLIKHFAQRGHLASPWGVALAPASFRRVRE